MENSNMLNQNQKYTLDSIAGYQNEKNEAIKIINLLKNYQTLKDMGVSIPRGLILSGNPGVGKTLFAKVISAEANVPFFEYEATEDDEPSKCIANIKKVYQLAKEHVPSIVFIDELDEILPNPDYRSDMTSSILKNLLTEIDGINSSNGVLTIATTNDYDSIPNALKRSGRMDKHIEFPLPDYVSRKSILKLYTSNNQYLKDIDINKIALKTQGFSGADLKVLLNESLINAITDSKDKVTTIDINRTIPLVGIKGIRQVIRKEPSSRVCYHEIGHFICHYALTNKPCDISVEKIGSVGGHIRTYDVLGIDKDDEVIDVEESYKTKTDLERKCIETLGGYAAEEIFTGEISTGVFNDVDKFGKIIMVMANLGLLGKSYMYISEFSNRRPLFSENNRIEDDPRREYFDYYLNKAKELINKYKDLAIFIYSKLYEKSSLDYEEVNQYIEEFYKKEKTI